MSEDFAPNTAPETPNAAQQGQQTIQIRYDDSKASSTYTNFCRVAGNPEEMIIEFGLNPQPVVSSSTPIVITDRVVMSYYTAKRMLLVLQATIQRHEQTFGELELDVQKRVLSQGDAP